MRLKGKGPPLKRDAIFLFAKSDHSILKEYDLLCIFEILKVFIVEGTLVFFNVQVRTLKVTQVDDFFKVIQQLRWPSGPQLSLAQFLPPCLACQPSIFLAC